MTGLICECRCDHCADTDCDGSVCAPHEPGRWLIESPFMEHPLPTDFATEETARMFIEALGAKKLTVREASHPDGAVVSRYNEEPER